MENIINITGVIGEIPDENGNIITPNTTFLDLVQQIESKKDALIFDVIIKSPGGYEEEGTEMYNYLMSLRAKGITVNTYADTLCASIGTKVFASGEKRLLIGSPDFMIHNPFGSPTEGDADYIEAYYKDLRKCENDLIAFYSEVTGTSKEAIKPLMKKETFLTNAQAINLGFATGEYQKTELKAIAYFKKNNLKPSNMSKDALTKDEANNLLEGLLEKIKNFVNPKIKIKAKLVQDANGAEIDFTDLEQDDTPSIGDNATIDGVTAEGEILMPSGETYVFVAGELTEIKTAESEDEPSEEMEALQEQVVNLEKELSTEKESVKNLTKENTKIKNLVTDMQSEIKAVKKSIGSNFSHDAGDKKDKKDQGKRNFTFKK